MEVYEIVKKLVGDIAPIGDSGYDKNSYKNLEVMIELLEAIVEDVEYITRYKV